MNFFQDNADLANIGKMHPQMAEWEKAADPSVRFENNYYTLARLSLLKNYHDTMSDPNNEPEDEMVAQEDLDNQLTMLRARYIADLELLLELKMTMANIWWPFKIKVQLDAA